jgi:hypothetical protein
MPVELYNWNVVMFLLIQLALNLGFDYTVKIEICVFKTDDAYFVFQSDLGLNEHHQMIIMNYMKFARYQRVQNLKAIEYAFKDVSESRYCLSRYLVQHIYWGGG